MREHPITSLFASSPPESPAAAAWTSRPASMIKLELEELLQQGIVCRCALRGLAASTLSTMAYRTPWLPAIPWVARLLTPAPLLTTPAAVKPGRQRWRSWLWV